MCPHYFWRGKDDAVITGASGGSGGAGPGSKGGRGGGFDLGKPGPKKTLGEGGNELTGGGEEGEI